MFSSLVRRLRSLNCNSQVENILFIRAEKSRGLDGYVIKLLCTSSIILGAMWVKTEAKVKHSREGRVRGDQARCYKANVNLFCQELRNNFSNPCKPVNRWLAITDQMEGNTDDMEPAALLGRKFFVQLEGKTNGAHESIVTELQGISHIKVESVEESEILVVFCPIVSRVGTDISNALENIPDDKQTVLVVMHPTFNPDHVVAQSRRLVEKPNVKLTVDCLFYDGKLLESNRNDIALLEIQKFIESPASE